MQEASRVFKIAANKHIMCVMLFTSFRDIRLGCCTVAAHVVISTGSNLRPSLFVRIGIKLVSTGVDLAVLLHAYLSLWFSLEFAIKEEPTSDESPV